MDPGLTGLTVNELKAFNWDVLRLYYDRIINDAYVAMGFTPASNTSPVSTTLEDRVRSLEQAIFPVGTGGGTPTNQVWVDASGSAFSLTGAQYAALKSGLAEVGNAAYNNWRSHYNAINALTVDTDLINYDVTTSWPTANVGTLDPSVSGFTANIGSLYFNTSTSNTYTKTGAGSTAWTLQKPGLATTNVSGIGAGIVVQDATNNVFVRTLTQPVAGITISNATGVAGNPTFALADDLSAVEGLTGTGIAVRTASNAWTNRSLAAGSTKISLTNADGVGGNISVDANEANFTLNNIGGTLGVAKGGTNLTAAPTNGQVLIGNGTGYTLATLGSSTGISVSNGAGTITINNTGVTSAVAGTGVNVSGATGAVTFSNTGVLSFAGGTTGLTPASATTGAISLAGTLVAANGGTGFNTYVVGDVLFADTTTTLARLAGVATGNALISGGVGTAPSWGKIGLTTHVSGTLPIANGGTNLTTTPTNGQLLIGNGTGYTLATLTQGSNITITNGAGTITIAATGGGSGPPYGIGCRAASPLGVNINVASPGATIDGVTMNAGDRVLLWQQTTPAQNGIYVWNGAATPMTRASDMDDWSEVPGRTVRVREGTSNEGAFYFCDAAVTGTIGTTAMTWTGDYRLGDAGNYYGGDSFTYARASSGGFGTRMWTMIDTIGYARLWRFDPVANGNSNGFEFAVGNNSDLANAANYWWDISTHSSGEEGFRIARRTGGGIVTKLFVDASGRVTIGNTTEPGGGSGGPNYASTNGVTLYVNSTDGIRIPVGTTAQRPTIIDGLIRHNTDEEIYEMALNPTTPAAYSTWSGFQKTAIWRKRRWWVDEFMAGSAGTTGTAVYGDMGWSVSAAGTPANSIITGVSDHPGILQLGTGTTSGNSTRIHLGQAATSAIILASQVERFAFLIRIPTITLFDIFVGLCNDISNGTVNSWGNDAVWFQFDNLTSANIQFRCRSGGVSSGAVNGPAFAANTWYLCEAYNTGSSWIPVINGVAYTAVATNNPTAAVNVGVNVVTTTTATRQVQIDMVQLYTRELGVRY